MNNKFIIFIDIIKSEGHKLPNSPMWVNKIHSVVPQSAELLVFLHGPKTS